ncbi:hypothetical protein Q5P01_009543 [Channa striata]|uniref:Uncharacterized protein n=1 Tax=Channa striata TaxID=64152 RepID=A0AA88MWA4_CHASR|nr:hypothetical protein Q5P01_009543 [Channa striata]
MIRGQGDGEASRIYFDHERRCSEKLRFPRHVCLKYPSRATERGGGSTGCSVSRRKNLALSQKEAEQEDRLEGCTTARDSHTRQRAGHNSGRSWFVFYPGERAVEVLSTLLL